MFKTRPLSRSVSCVLPTRDLPRLQQTPLLSLRNGHELRDRRYNHRYERHEHGARVATQAHFASGLPAPQALSTLPKLKELRFNSTNTHHQQSRAKLPPELLTHDVSPMELADLSRPWNHISKKEVRQARDDFLNMVDVYEDFQNGQDVNIKQNTVVVISERKQESTSKSKTDLQSDADVTELCKVLENDEVSNQEIYRLYSRLPRPGVTLLNPGGIEALLKRLGQVEFKDRDQAAMLQYLTVFDDMHTAGLRPHAGHWATAMHLSGRYARTVTSAELDNTMRIWRRMEKEAKLKSDTTTMNIMLDVATKSGHFALSDFVLREMQLRGLPYDRFTYLGRIYLQGCKQNGQGVRAAYQDFVNAEEVVDSMVLTCVITSLLKSGELPAAMNVYRRMLLKASHDHKHHGTPEHVTDLGRQIAKFSREQAVNPGMIEKLQSGLMLAPNVLTYITLIRHHVQHTGELVPIAKLLDEMHGLGIHVHGQLFIELFNGFELHGSKLYTSWTPTRLEDVWSAFLEIVDLGLEDVYVAPVTASAAIRAFRRCRSEQRTQEITRELEKRWRRTERHTTDMNVAWLPDL